MSPRSLPLLAALSFLLASSLGAAGLAPRLVKDINPLSQSQSSLPSDYVTVGGTVFFAADDGETGQELWRTDGTAGGTYRLVDACAGECSSRPSFFAVSDHQYFFAVTDESGRRELWVSGGTPATTLALTPLTGSTTTFDQRLWVPGLHLLLFANDDGVHGPELWRSDGTPGGTYQVAELFPGTRGANPREMVAFKDRLYFVADDPQRGPILWKSDGTPQGTQAVRDPLPGTAIHPGPESLRVAGNYLYFFAPTPALRAGLWKSDGTTRGTAPLIDFTPSPVGAPVFWDTIVLGKRLLFVADDGRNGQELWATDGTQPGTRMLTHLAPADAFHGRGGDFFLYPTFLGNRLAFAVNDGVHGGEPWITDGTPAGTHLIKDVCPGSCSGAAYVYGAFGGKALFTGNDPAKGQEMWVTDGTAAGTHMLRDVCPGSCGSYPGFLFAAGTQAFFATNNPSPASGAFTQLLWRTDGTTRGTVQVANVGLQGSGGEGFGGAVLGNTLVFSAQDDDHGDELWRSDGTPQGTGLLVDINSSNTAGSFPQQLMAVGGQVFFFASDGTRNGLWKSDGTASGTSLVQSQFPGGLTDPTSLGGAGSKAYFTLLHTVGGTGHYELWRSDGTEAGTILLTPPAVGVSSLALQSRAVGDTFFFIASELDPETGLQTQLWKTDGTPAGTVPLANVTYPANLTPFQGRLYFTSSTVDERNELWVSDGTPAGTHLVKDINPGDLDSDPSLLTEHAGRLWFLANDGTHGRELWSTDGTAAGTQLAIDLAPGARSFTASALLWKGNQLFLLDGGMIDDDGRVENQGLWVTDLTPGGTRRISPVRSAPGSSATAPVLLGGTMFFDGTLDASGGADTLWISDGTEAGTVPLPDKDGHPVYGAASFQIFAGRVVFTAGAGAGVGLWQSDGTPAGTFVLRDQISPSPPFSSPFAQGGSHLFFSSFDHDTGTELWAVDGP
jgi:ELWxxDGT repeat protein